MVQRAIEPWVLAASGGQVIDGTYGRLRDIVVGPDGWLYFTTSNRDGRGTPQDGDDHVYRLVLR